MEVLIAILIAVAVLALTAATWFFLQKRRTEQLRDRFGPEYERTVRDVGDRRRAEHAEYHDRDARRYENTEVRR